MLSESNGYPFLRVYPMDRADGLMEAGRVSEEHSVVFLANASGPSRDQPTANTAGLGTAAKAG